MSVSQMNGKPHKMIALLKAIGFEPNVVTVGAINADNRAEGWKLDLYVQC